MHAYRTDVVITITCSYVQGEMMIHTQVDWVSVQSAGAGNAAMRTQVYAVLS
jgi:hypothetical protein